MRAGCKIGGLRLVKYLVANINVEGEIRTRGWTVSESRSRKKQRCALQTVWLELYRIERLGKGAEMKWKAGMVACQSLSGPWALRGIVRPK